MMRSGPPKRKTPLPRPTKPLKRTEVKRSASPKRQAPKERPTVQVRTTPRPNRGTEDWPDFNTAKDIVKERCGGRCEAGIVCRGTGLHQNTHHRKLRRFKDHRPVNLIAVCFACHEYIHHHVLEANARGYLVWSWLDPADIPITPWVLDP